MMPVARVLLLITLLGCVLSACSRDEVREPAEAKRKGKIVIAYQDSPAGLATANVLKAVLEKQGISTEAFSMDEAAGQEAMEKSEVDALLSANPAPARPGIVSLGPVVNGGDAAQQQNHLYLLVRQGLQQENQPAYAILDGFHWSPEDLRQVIAWTRESDQEDPFQSAMRWVEQNPGKIAPSPSGGNP